MLSLPEFVAASYGVYDAIDGAFTSALIGVVKDFIDVHVIH